MTKKTKEKSVYLYPPEGPLLAFRGVEISHYNDDCVEFTRNNIFYSWNGVYLLESPKTKND
jgi:hypothetical protein